MPAAVIMGNGFHLALIQMKGCLQSDPRRSRWNSERAICRGRSGSFVPKTGHARHGDADGVAAVVARSRNRAVGSSLAYQRQPWWWWIRRRCPGSTCPGRYGQARLAHHAGRLWRAQNGLIRPLRVGKQRRSDALISKAIWPRPCESWSIRSSHGCTGFGVARFQRRAHGGEKVGNLPGQRCAFGVRFRVSDKSRFSAPVRNASGPPRNATSPPDGLAAGQPGRWSGSPRPEKWKRPGLPWLAPSLIRG